MDTHKTPCGWYALMGVLVLSALVIAFIAWSALSAALAPLVATLAGLG